MFGRSGARSRPFGGGRAEAGPLGVQDTATPRTLLAIGPPVAPGSVAKTPEQATHIGHLVEDARPGAQA